MVIIRCRRIHSSVFLAFMVPILCFCVGAHGQQIFSLSDTPTALLDSNYYDGTAANGEPSAAGGRGAFAAAADFTGTRVAFWSASLDGGGARVESGIFTVDVGDPSSWERITNTGEIPGFSNLITWGPDGVTLFSGSPLQTIDLVGPIESPGVTITPFLVGVLPIDTGTNTLFRDGTIAVGILQGPDLQGAGLPFGDSLIAGAFDFEGNITDEFTPMILTTFPIGTELGSIYLSNDGTMISFQVWKSSTDAGIDCGFVGDELDLYIIDDIPSIVDAGVQLIAPVSLNPVASFLDSRVVKARVDDSAGGWVHTAAFSEDNSLIIFSEDFNDVFSLCAELDGSTFNLADFDVMIGRRDGTMINGANSGGDIRLIKGGNQLINGATKGGLRLLLQETGAGPLQDEIFLTSLVITNAVADIPVPEGMVLVDTDGDGIIDGEVTVGDNATKLAGDPLIDDDIVIEDVSGTELSLDAGTVIDYPPGPQEITIETPSEPVEDIAIPEGLELVAIPVVRDFGPEGTKFFPPIEVTISYTDGEVAGLDEFNLVVLLFNSGTGLFEEVPGGDIVGRDFDGNTITFRVAHFSTFGLGGKAVVAMPLSQWMVFATCFALALVALVSLQRRRKANSTQA